MPHPDMGMIEIAYAKVNIALHVQGRRADGYHEIESLFAFAEDGDRLIGQISNGGQVSLRLRGPFSDGLEGEADNLVLKAARAFKGYLGEERGACLTLEKNLPIASGVGGGSADAAATLRLLSRLWSAELSRREIEAIALQIGSDVPACIASEMQIVRGRGELLEPVSLPELAGCPMLLVNPRIAVSTARVFAGWDTVDKGGLVAGDLEQLIVEGRNDLELPAIVVAPPIADVLSALRQTRDVKLARMSGSGATCFALFDRSEDMNAAASSLREAHPNWWVMETRIRSV